MTMTGVMKHASLAIALAMPAVRHAVAAELQAGAAKVSITPAADEFPFVYEQGRGCEPHFDTGAPCNFVGVHDKIFARALNLSDGHRSVVLVMVEATAVPDPVELRSKIAKAVGLAETDVLLAATHTHEVPLVKYHGGTPDTEQQREITRLENGAVEAARQAKANLQAARVSFGRGTGWINVNNGDRVGTAGYDPLGPSDKTLDVMKVTGADGKPIALLVDYASHAEVMYRSVTKDGGYEVTGDIPGVVSATLEASPAGAPVALFAAAAEGDQLSMFKSLQGAAGALPAADEGASGWALLDEMARRLTLSVFDILNTMPAGSDTLRVDAASTTATCPGQHKHVDPASGKTVADITGPVSIPLDVLRIGDIALAGVGGDLGSEIGTAVKRSSPIPQTMLISMTAGSVGYILADSSYDRDSHGIMGSPLQPHCAERAISDGLDGLIKSLWAQP